jgi:hypothetical protein
MAWILVFGTHNRGDYTDEYVLQKIGSGPASKRMGLGMKIGIGAGAVLVLGLIGWLATRKK